MNVYLVHSERENCINSQNNHTVWKVYDWENSKWERVLLWEQFQFFASVKKDK